MLTGALLSSLGSDAVGVDGEVSGDEKGEVSGVVRGEEPKHASVAQFFIHSSSNRRSKPSWMQLSKVLSWRIVDMARFLKKKKPGSRDQQVCIVDIFYGCM